MALECVLPPQLRYPHRIVVVMHHGYQQQGTGDCEASEGHPPLLLHCLIAVGSQVDAMAVADCCWL